MAAFPPLRSDLTIVPQCIDGEHAVIIKDPVKQTYFRFDELEYYLLSLLNGKRSSGQIARMVNEKYRTDFTGKEVRQFIYSTSDQNLFQKSEEDEYAFLYEQMREQRKSMIRQAKGSLLYFRIPLVDPNLFFDRLLPYVRWLWSPGWVFACVLFMISALVLLVQHHDAVTVHLAHTFDFGNASLWSLVSLWFVVMLTIGVHELGHGMTCKYYGGECHEIGFLFLMLTPCMYANVNDSWLFPKKRDRLFVVFAGCYFEVLFGCMAVYLWWLTQPGSFINLMAFQIVMVSFFSTILLNLNPMMKFDGYFALSDLLEVPNLKQSAKEYTSYLFNTRALRLDEEEPDLTRRKQWILTIYGTCAAIYMFNMKLGLVFMASNFLIGKLQLIGLLLTCGIIYKIYGSSWIKYFNLGRRVMAEHQAFFKKRLVRAAGAMSLLAVLIVLFFVPFSYHLEVKAQLKPVREVLLRAGADGFVVPKDSAKLRYTSGEVILRQQNQDLDLAAVKNQIAHMSQRAGLLGALAGGQPSAVQRQQKLTAKLERESEDLRRQQDNQVLRAPFDGILVRSLEGFENTFARTGDQLERFIDPSVYEAEVEVPESELESVEQGMAAWLTLASRPGKIYQGSVVSISPVHSVQGAARYYRLKVAFPNEQEELRQGMNGKVHLYAGEYTPVQRVLRVVQKTIRLDLQM